MVKNLVSEPIWPFGPDLGPNFFSSRIYLYCMLGIVTSNHCMQLQGNIMNEIWVNGKKPRFGANFGPFAPNWTNKYFL